MERSFIINLSSTSQNLLRSYKVMEKQCFLFSPRKSNKEVKNQRAFGRQRSKSCKVQRLGQIRSHKFQSVSGGKVCRNNRLGVSGNMVKWAAGDRRGSVCQSQGNVGEWLMFCSMDGFGSWCYTQGCTMGKWQWRESSLLQGWVSVLMNGASHLRNADMI